jgi:hypothetical protein
MGKKLFVKLCWKDWRNTGQGKPWLLLRFAVSCQSQDVARTSGNCQRAPELSEAS